MAPKVDEFQPHPVKEQLPGVDYCLTSSPPWRTLFCIFEPYSVFSGVLFHFFCIRIKWLYAKVSTFFFYSLPKDSYFKSSFKLCNCFDSLMTLTITSSCLVPAWNLLWFLIVLLVLVWVLFVCREKDHLCFVWFILKIQYYF